MSAVSLHPDEGQSATEQLLERSWEARERRASERELAVDASAALLFLAAAAALLLHPGVSSPNLGRALLLVAVYALVARVEFPVGAGYVVPTQLVLVPMLVLLPPALVPAAVGAGLVLGNAIDWSLGRVPGRRVLSAIPDAWHAIGPALVLIAAGSPTIGFAQLPVLMAAFAAGCMVDLAGSLVRMRLAGLVPRIRLQIQVIALVWAVDAGLAPLGLLAALQMRQRTAAIALVLPLVCLLWLLARDRNQRIDQAHRRLKLVEQERARLQSAVRRLGDAFAAKLELDRLLEILLHGSVEALDAAAGHLRLAYGRSPIDLSVGAAQLLDLPGSAGEPATPVQFTEDGGWRLGMPVRITAPPREVPGTLWLARAGRPFEEDEIALIGELISKAELSAGEIIAHHAIREQAMTDPLTGLGNRRRLSTDLAAALAARSPDWPSLLLLFDLDGFKDYNDTFGHVAGDALLARLGAKLEHAVESWGRAYRLGGDEFCAHLELRGAPVDALIRTASSALTEVGAEFTVQASLGVVLLPQEADSAEQALRIADERMYANKRSRSTARFQAGEVLLRAMQAKQAQLDEHSATVADLAARVAQRLGVRGEALEEISRAAQLHDIGKVGIPDAILNKPARLSRSEWASIRNHTILGERIIAGAAALRGIAPLVRASHERWDGTGYPDRLRGEEIPLGARIVTVCDAYEAMTTERAYRAAISPEAARRELLRCAGTQFDPAVVDAFLSVLDGAAPDRELDGAHHAAAHVRTLLGAASSGYASLRSAQFRRNGETASGGRRPPRDRWPGIRTLRWPTGAGYLERVSETHRDRVETLLSDAAAEHATLMTHLPAELRASIPVDAQGVTQAIDHLAVAAGLSPTERRALIRPHAVNPAVLHARVFGRAPLARETVIASFVEGARVRADALAALADKVGGASLGRDVREVLVADPPPIRADGPDVVPALRATYAAHERAAMMIAAWLDRPDAD